LLNRLLELGWLARDSRTRAVRVTGTGAAAFPRDMGVELP
jgi:hypothetical protein